MKDKSGLRVASCTMSSRGAKAATASALVLGSTLVAGPALAQGATGPNSGQEEAQSAGFEDIIVTARRVEESAQRVPVAVTTFSGESLASVNVVDVTQLQKMVPGVNLCCQPFNNRTNTYVRGIRNGAPTYFADVPVSSEGYSNFFDIDSFDVLKGPQGTLFGQASNAGAFVISPKRPGDSLGGHISATYGDYDRRTIEGAIDIPLVADRALFRFAGISSRRRGYVENQKTGDFHGEEDYWIVRPSLTLRITDNLENHTLYERSRADVNGFSRGLWVISDFNLGATPDPLRVETIRRQIQLGRYKIQGISTGCASPNGPIRGPSPAQVTSLDYLQVACPRDIYEQDRLINTTTFEINGDWSLKNIFGYVSEKQLRGPADFAGSPLVILNTYSPRNTRPSEPTAAGGVDPTNGWSNEFQVYGRVGIFDITAGIFIFRHDYDTGILFADFNNQFESASREKGFKDSEGYYAQTDVHLDSLLAGLTATAGLRYTEDEIGLELTPYNVNTLQPGAPTVTTDDPNGFAKFDNVSYTAGVRYQFAPSTMFYITTARGYGSGGLQNVSGYETYDPSVLTNYEGGVKSTFDIGNVPIRLNASYFYGKFDDVQVSAFVPITRQDGATTYTSVVSNAAKAIVEGYEIEASIRPFSGLELGGWVAYTDNRYTEFRSFNPVTGAPMDLSNTKFTTTPAWKSGLNGRYTLPLPPSLGEISLHGTLSHRSKIINRLTPVEPTNPSDPFSGLVCTRARTVENGYPAVIANGEIVDYDCSRGYTTIDGGITWDAVLGNDDLSFDFLVTNITENVASDSAANVPGSRFISRQPAIPRMWSLRARIKF